jgi:hypothetical protein
MSGNGIKTGHITHVSLSLQGKITNHLLYNRQILVIWLLSSLVDDWLNACLVNCMASWMFGLLFRWLEIGCLAGRLVGWFYG